MIISRYSWHYQLLEAYGLEHGADSLCPYVRRVVLAIGISGFFWPLLLVGSRFFSALCGHGAT